MIFRKLAFEYAETLKIDHPFDRESKIAGEDWLDGFLKKNPKLSIRKPKPTSRGHAVGFNKPQVDGFYNNLQVLIEQHNLTAHQVWNVDESGLTTVHTPQNIIAKIGAKHVGKMTNGEKSKTITTLCCTSAGGTFVPPMLIFPRKNMAESLMNGASSGAVGYASPNGWIDGGIFVMWMKHFICHVNPSTTNRHVIILDGHCSHKTLEVISLARDNGIDLLVLPPHTTHRLQPLDTVFYKLLSDCYNAAADRWKLTNAGRRISFYEVASLFCEAYEKTATVAKASSGFRCTGIWPFNPDVFDAAEFALSIVTDKPLTTASDSSDAPAVNTVSTSARQSEGMLSTRVVSCKSSMEFSRKLAKNDSKFLLKFVLQIFR